MSGLCPEHRCGEGGDILRWPAIPDLRRLRATTPCIRGRRTVAIAFMLRNPSKPFAIFDNYLH